MLGDAEQLKTGYMLAEHENLVDEGEFFESKELTVRIRYRSKPIPCDVKRLEDGRLLVHFQTEASAIAPGQSARILYRPKGSGRFLYRFPKRHRGCSF